MDIIEIAILIIIGVALSNRYSEKEIFSFILQTIYMIIAIIVGFYFHEAGHYAAKKYYFPNTKSQFVWSRFFFIPIPCKVTSDAKSLAKSNVTYKNAFVVLLAGPIAGFIPVLASYFVLNIASFVILLGLELFSCTDDFKKLHWATKEWAKKTD